MKNSLRTARKTRFLILTVLFVSVIALSGCMAQEQVTTTTIQETAPIVTEEIGGIYQTVSPAHFNKKIQSREYIVLDVRTQEEYDAARISQDALLIDFYAPDFEERINGLDKEKKYLLYCRSGNRSDKTRAFMEERAFHEVIELSGGISNWSASYPVVQ